MSAHAADRGRWTGRSVRVRLSPKRISAVYVLLALIVLFSLWVPETFLTTTNLKALLNQQAITGILSIGLVIPLAAGAFDFSVGATLGVSAIFS